MLLICTQDEEVNAAPNIITEHRPCINKGAQHTSLHKPVWNLKAYVFPKILVITIYHADELQGSQSAGARFSGGVN